MEDIDMVNRDPNNINDHVKVTYDNVLAEVDGMHSIDCVWKLAFKCFIGGKNCCYKFLTLLTGLCLGLMWGCCFACIAFRHIWCLTPCLACYNIECGFMRKYYTTMIESMCGPCCSTLGLCFSQIHVHNK